MDCKNGPSLVFQEATVENILRVCTIVKTHPSIHISKLKNDNFADKTKKGACTVHQLVETIRKTEDIEVKSEEPEENKLLS